MAEWNSRANEVFLRAVEIEPADKRHEFLDAECDGDGHLRLQVEALIAASEKVGSFLNRPAAQLSKTAGPTGDYQAVTNAPG
jgi:hypothetical protein